MQENGSVSFVAILFQLWRKTKTKFNIFDKYYDQCFFNFADRTAPKVIAFSFSREEKRKLKHNTKLLQLPFMWWFIQLNLITFPFPLIMDPIGILTFYKSVLNHWWHFDILKDLESVRPIYFFFIFVTSCKYGIAHIAIFLIKWFFLHITGQPKYWRSFHWIGPTGPIQS